MSSFSVPPLVGGIHFDVSSFTGGMDKVIAGAAAMPATIASGIDAPMQHAATAINQIASAAGLMGAGTQRGMNIAKGAADVAASSMAHAGQSAAGMSPPALQAAAAMNQLSAAAGHVGSATGQGMGAAREATERVAASMDHASQSAEGIGKAVEHGTLAAEAAMKLFPAIVIEFIESPILGAIALLVEMGEKAKEAAEYIIDVFKEVGSHAGDSAFAAEKAGVSPEFFSQWAEAGRSVRVGAEQISQGMKFLQKNAVDAADGVSEAKKAFDDLEISQSFLASNLNNTQAIWEMVHDRISTLPTAAERARRSMEVAGKGGADMALLLGMSAKQFDSLTEAAKRFGTIEDGGSAGMGKKWQQITVQIEEAWEGLKRKFAEPILDYFAEHWDEILPKLERVADAIGKLIPKALELMKDAFGFALEAVGAFLGGLEKVAEVTDAFGWTHDAAQTVQAARDATHNIRVELQGIHFDINPEKATEQIAQKLTPYVYDALNQHAKAIRGEKVAHHVARALTGRWH